VRDDELSVGMCAVCANEEVPVKPKRAAKGKAMGYVCPTCGEQIYDKQPTAHTDDGLAHTKCAAP